MGTPFSVILTQWALQDIDDINWQRELAISPARFFRAKSDTLIRAIPRFNRPPYMQSWLKYSKPNYNDYLYTAQSAQTAGFSIQTGEVGFEMASAVLVGKDEVGLPSYSPVSVGYDAVTGDVTVNADVAEGQQIDIDFYTDGYFDRELDDEMCHILSLCIAYTWLQRFVNTWLNMQPKIKDKSFDVGSESAQMTANTAKLKEARLALNDALLHYEENVAYAQKTDYQPPFLKPPVPIAPQP